MAENMITLAFRPNSFDGLHPELASAWLKHFNRYTDLTNTDGAQRCTLFGLLLSGSAETWFNTLPEAIRHNDQRLERGFRSMYVDAEHTRL